jgi:hypothetical protein
MERIPVATYLADNHCVIHMRELLECGHEFLAYTPGDPLTAKHRVCRACAQTSSAPIPALPPKKSAARALPQSRYEPPGPASIEEAKKTILKFFDAA